MIVSVLESLGYTFQLHIYSKLTAGLRFLVTLRLTKNSANLGSLFQLLRIGRIITGEDKETE